jgi:hypothetical protein
MRASQACSATPALNDILALIQLKHLVFGRDILDWQFHIPRLAAQQPLLQQREYIDTSPSLLR